MGSLPKMKIVLTTISLLAAFHFFQVFLQLDLSREGIVFNVHPSSRCFRVEGIQHGSEDIVSIPGTSYAIISSGFIPTKPSGMFFFDFDHPELPASKFELVKTEPVKTVEGDSVPYTITAPVNMSSFHPHGIDVFEVTSPQPNAFRRYHVLIVNHHPDYEGIERYMLDLHPENPVLLPSTGGTNPPRLHYVETHKNAEMKFVNDVVAAQPAKDDGQTMFFTNFFSTRAKWWPPLIFALQIPDGNVGFYDGKVGRSVSQGSLFVGNGIARTPDSRFLVTASTGSRSLTVFATDDLKATSGKFDSATVASSALRIRHHYNLNMLVDNVIILPGRERSSLELWVAGQYIGHRAIRNFVLKEGLVSPSFAVRASMNPQTGELTNWRLSLLDDGSLVDTASVATPSPDLSGVLFGTVDNFMTYCPLSQDSDI